MTRTFAALTLCLVPALASAQQAPAAPPAAAAPAASAPSASAPGAPASAAGQEAFEMSCSYFHRNPDGRWNATRPMTLQPASGPLVLRPTTKFARGTLFGGFDLATALDGACPH